MKYSSMIFFLFAVHLSFGQLKPASRTIVKVMPDSHKFWLFLLAGQSNMAGRGDVEASDTLPQIRVLTLNKQGTWEIAKDPIHFDRDYAGVGPGLSFGKSMSGEDSTIYIGLIPCAVGGSSINSWKPVVNELKPNNYAAAIQRCKSAMKFGILKGIIWLQGESDCTENNVVSYEDKLENVVRGFRTDLGMTDLPFIAGLLPDFQKEQPNKQHILQNNPFVDQINESIKDLTKRLSNYGYVTSEGTEHRGDHLHFNSKSARLMGKRYAELMMKMLKQSQYK